MRILALALLSCACGSSSGDAVDGGPGDATTVDGAGASDAAPGQPGEETASVLVVASAGATIPAGGATIDIPANALAADTQIEAQFRIDPFDDHPVDRWAAGPVLTLLPHGTSSRSRSS